MIELKERAAKFYKSSITFYPLSAKANLQPNSLSLVVFIIKQSLKLISSNFIDIKAKSTDDSWGKVFFTVLSVRKRKQIAF